MNSSNRNMNFNRPREGDQVRLIGLKNPALNGKIGTITSYSGDGERVMVSLDGAQGIVKVKPKQVEAADGSNGRAMMRNSMSQNPRSSMRNSMQNPRSSMRNSSRDMLAMNGSSARSLNYNGSSARGLNRAGSQRSLRGSSRHLDAAESAATDGSTEAMETLRSADAMFDLADTSGDGVISQEEFEHYMTKHTNHDIGMIRECFYMIDVDHNGDITRDEVRNAFLKKRRELKGDMSQSKQNFEDELIAVSKDADLLFDRADVDRNGTLSLREFELYMKRNTTHSDDAIHQIFKQMDVDSDGYITREEVRKAYLKQKKGDGGKLSLGDLLGLEDDDMEDIEDDVYSMFFLAKFGSQGFWFAIVVFLLKLGLIMIIAIDLYTEGVFPEREEVSALVRTTQFLLLPVNVSVQEELITTFFIYANLKWCKEILELNPGASKAKFHIANLMRFLDGISFLFINTTLLLQATQVLGAFLNFAALQFLSSIDNVALHLARDGYLTESLESVAGDVLLMKLSRNHNDCLQVLDSILLGVVFVMMLIAWAVFAFVI